MRVLFALPGLHRENRGAERAFISIASELTRLGHNVTLIGSGDADPRAPYRFLHAGSISRKRFESYPFGPVLRHEFAYEELTFVTGLLWQYRPADYEVTLSCGYPFTNWALRRPVVLGSRPPHVFVTQNGDWPAVTRKSEGRLFGCEGIVCTNPVYFERNKERWRARFIPNGVDCNLFSPGPAKHDEFGLPSNRTIVLMVSALDEAKRVGAGVEAVSHIPDAHLVVAGDGPLREEISDAAQKLLPGRFTRLSVPMEKMPSLYRCANVFMHLAKHESSPLAFLEALASGLPVVAHDQPQLKYIVGDDEFLLDTEDPKLVAQKIKLARDAPAANAQKRTMKAAAFSWTSLAVQYQDFLREIVKSS